MCGLFKLIFGIIKNGFTDFFAMYSQANVYKDQQIKRTKLFEGYQTKCMVCIPPHHELRKRKGEQVKNGTFIDIPLNLLDGMKGLQH